MDLKELSYYQTGGSCDRIVYPESIQDLADVMAGIYKEKTRYFILGAGSNSLIMDDHWPGVVIVLKEMQSVSVSGNNVIAQAGLTNTLFAQKCLEACLEGASWMSHLPGFLGSSIRMNARCYGGEVSNIVNSVTVVTREGEIKSYGADEVFLGYKKTIFMENTDIIAKAEFSLKTGDKQKIANHMAFCRMDREQKHQFLHPSCGCVFKNDYSTGVPSGLLLEEAGVRRFNRNRVEISSYHANFVFNKGTTAREILEVTLEMRDAVHEQFGVWLEYEMEILGIIPEDLKEEVIKKRNQDLNLQRLAPLQEIFSS
jgi:UDP-N-acetylmuramate dehydrogenase